MLNLIYLKVIELCRNFCKKSSSYDRFFKKNANKIVFFNSIVILILVITLEGTQTYAKGTFDNISPSASFDQQSNKNLLSKLFGNKTISTSSDIFISSEIWTRVRGHLSLKPARSIPLFDKHVKSLAKSQDYIDMVVRNASPYLYYIFEEVQKRGMPGEIALLPVIESDFNPHTRSHKGALGLWQIMPSLGRLHGLKQNAWYDGRKDVYESTKVALDHLEYLHKKFNGNWLLAIAAYNCGEVRVERAIKQNKSAKKSTDLWSLKLPKETTHFVPKLLAVAAIVKTPDKYGVNLPNIPDRPAIVRIHTGKAVTMADAANLAAISETQLQKLNPALPKKQMPPNGPFDLVVPAQQAAHVKEKIDKLPVPVVKTQEKKKITNKPKSRKTATSAGKAKTVTKAKKTSQTKKATQAKKPQKKKTPKK